MRLLPFSVHIVSLTLLSLSAFVHAQADTVNENVTIRFLPDSQGDSCDYHDSDNAISFTTLSTNSAAQCFNFARLFGGNETRGSRDLTVNGTGGFHWSISNAQSFDANANYSRVLYRQHLANATQDKYKVGHTASRQVTLYSGLDCSDIDEVTKNRTQPWFGFSCWSEDQGSCGTLPYSIVSFAVGGIPEQIADKDNCWVFAKSGEQSSGAHIHASLQAVMGAFAVVALFMWLAV